MKAQLQEKYIPSNYQGRSSDQLLIEETKPCLKSVQRLVALNTRTWVLKYPSDVHDLNLVQGLLLGVEHALQVVPKPRTAVGNMKATQLKLQAREYLENLSMASDAQFNIHLACDKMIGNR